jgi:hypothetical protein
VGTGKSTVAQALAQREGWKAISSDATRKSLAGVSLTEHRFEEFDRSIYSPEFSRKTYAHMFDEAREILSQGQSVIIDASFKKKEERERVSRLAWEANARFLAVECVLDEETVKSRLERRLEEGSISDGRWEIFERQKRDFDEITEIPPKNYLVVDTSRPVEELLSSVMERMSKL